MLKFASTNTKTGERVYFLGLSRDNINRLTSGQPIKVDLKDLGAGSSTPIVIAFGETEQMIYLDLKAAGVIPPEIGPSQN